MALLRYKPNTVSNGHDPYPNVIPIGPIPHEKPWFSDDDEAKFSREGIMQLVSLEDDMDREFYGGLLSPIYGAAYIESLPLNDLKNLFDEHLRNMEIR